MTGTVIVLVSSGWLLTVAQIASIACLCRLWWAARRERRALHEALRALLDESYDERNAA